MQKRPLRSASAALLHYLLCCAIARCLLADDFSYIGCFVDSQGGVRDLNGLVGGSTIGSYSVDSNKGFTANSMTLQLCASVCSIGRFLYFGTQYGSWCFCSNAYGSQGVAAVADCNMACAGNPSQICGAGDRNSVYRLTNSPNNLFVLSTRAYANKTSGAAAAYRTLPSRGLMDCSDSCRTDCQAVLMSPGICYLLKASILPTELINIPGELFVRQ